MLTTNIFFGLVSRDLITPPGYANDHSF